MQRRKTTSRGGQDLSWQNKLGCNVDAGIGVFVGITAMDLYLRLSDWVQVMFQSWAQNVSARIDLSSFENDVDITRGLTNCVEFLFKTPNFNFIASPTVANCGLIRSKHGTFSADVQSYMQQLQTLVSWPWWNATMLLEGHAVSSPDRNELMTKLHSKIESIWNSSEERWDPHPSAFDKLCWTNWASTFQTSSAVEEPRLIVAVKEEEIWITWWPGHLLLSFHFARVFGYYHRAINLEVKSLLVFLSREIIDQSVADGVAVLTIRDDSQKEMLMFTNTLVPSVEARSMMRNLWNELRDQQWDNQDGIVIQYLLQFGYMEYQVAKKWCSTEVDQLLLDGRAWLEDVLTGEKLNPSRGVQDDHKRKVFLIHKNGPSQSHRWIHRRQDLLVKSSKKQKRKKRRSFVSNINQETSTQT